VYRADARIAAAGARRGREQADGSGQREREDKLLSTQGHLLRGYARTVGSRTYERPRELVNPKITSSRTEHSEDHGFAG
jgi:hypothetical protein